MLLGLVVLSGLLHAAPIPATSSSALVTGHKGLFRSPVGFEISSENTDWEITPPLGRNPYLLTEYRSPDWSYGVQGAMTVRVDTQSKAKNLKGYVKQWLKDYARYGLRVTASRPVSLGGQQAQVIDMLNATNHRQLRQYLFHKQNKTIILTCRSHEKRFDKTVKDCNQIARNFRWM